MTADTPPTQKPIYKMWAERKGKGYLYYGLVKDAPKWEALESSWVIHNFAQYTDWLKALENNGGQPLIVPGGRAVGALVLGGHVSDDHGCIGGSGLIGVSVPSVTYQGGYPFCASYGLASALRFCGYADHAAKLEALAETVLACKTNQAARAVHEVQCMGGWQESPRLPNFNPLTDRSPHPTIVQLCASDGDNTHVVGIAGDWIFDSNLHRAKPLCKESLDDCCVGATTFLRVSYAVRFVPNRRLKRKRIGA
jgi:hypothetical protein